MKSDRTFCDHCGKEINKTHKNVRIQIEIRNSGEYRQTKIYDDYFELCVNCTLQLNDYINKYMEGFSNGQEKNC